MIPRILLVGTLAGAAGVAYRIWPDVQRYLRIKSM